MSTTRQLFGGALFSAGLVLTLTSPAIATGSTFPFDVDEDNFIGTGAHYVQDGGAITSGAITAFANGPNGTAPGTVFDSLTDRDGNTLGGTATLTDKLMRADAYGSAEWLAYGPGYEYFTDAGALSRVEAWVTPETNLWIRATWNNEATSLPLEFILHIQNFETGVIEVSIQDSPSGDLTHMLNAGDRYRISIYAFTDPTEDDTSWTQVVVVPAPGAAALLGCAMLIGRRRRRCHNV